MSIAAMDSRRGLQKQNDLGVLWWPSIDFLYVKADQEAEI